MRLLGAVLVLCLVAGCGSEPAPVTPTALPRASLGPWGAPAPPTAPPASASATKSPRPTARPTSGGWEITVYYTAVEELHDGEEESVTGCRGLDCAHGDADLGEYPAGFVEAVESEGTGRTADGKYLNWSYDIGYWLDTAPRDTAGRRLEPFVSAAADPGVLPRGTTFRIAGCGRTEDGGRPHATVCAALRDGRWKVTDEFTPGLGGSRHLDLYIGEETGRDFTSSAWYLSLVGVSLLKT